MSAGEFRLPSDGSRGRALRPSGKFVPLSHLRKLRGSEQVAAVCYRVRGEVIEFLLVQTRGGRWIFPKGSAEPGLTHAQAAALEAFEEAGVHGRIEERPFSRYVRRKSAENGNSASVAQTVHAYLCEVLWLDRPQELDRNPAWFSAEKAQRRLRDDRGARYGFDLAQVIERAVMRIRRLHHASTFVDSIQKIRFIDDAGQLPREKRKVKFG